MTPVDDAFVRGVVAAADAAVGRLLHADADAAAQLAAAPLGPHREAMRRVKLLVAAYLVPHGSHAAADALLERAEEYATALRGMQGPSGLFVGGDNIESPPDSGFTLNDVGDTLELIRRVGASRRETLSVLEATLASIADRATPAMLAGGVHTPNHRWELAAALSRLHRHRPDEAVRRRIEQWLDEGIDIDDDGLYSERSANYAAHVSNPSLMAIGDILHRPELHRIVERNLEATLGLIHPDRSVETVHSRRQDQKGGRFSLAPYLMPYRRFAVERGRGDFAWAAERAREEGIAEPQSALTDLLLDPRYSDELPPPEPPAALSRRSWPGSALVVDAAPERTLVIYGGSDYPRFRRIRSGLASNPTFLRMFAGDVVLESVRLSRDFFGLGPFRPSGIAASGDGFVLPEEIEGAYYQPLPPKLRRADGAYDIVDEGRFAAAMSFDRRTADAVTLRTRVDVRPTADGVDLEIDLDGPSLGWALELAFRPGGRFEDVTELGDAAVRLDEGFGRYRVGEHAVEFGPGTGVLARARYAPGEEYEHLGGTDAAGGPRAYLTGRVPGTFRVTIRAVGPGEQPVRADPPAGR